VISFKFVAWLLSGLLSVSSFQGWIIKKVFGKLKLEHVVIGKGQFEQERAKPNVLEVILLFFFLPQIRSTKIGQHQSECKWEINVTDDTALFF
jgi:hypothetical protein